MKKWLGVGASLCLGFSLSFLLSRDASRISTLSTTAEDIQRCESLATFSLSNPDVSESLAEAQPLNRIVHGAVLSVSFSPDGKSLVSASYGGGEGKRGLLLWDVARQTSTVLQGGDVFAAEFSPDGKQIAYSVSNRLFLFDLKTQTTNNIGQQPAFILGFSFSPDGKQIATGSSNGYIYLWDLAQKNYRTVGRSRNGDVDAVTFSPDGQTIASGGDDGPPTLWDLRRGMSTQVGGPAGAEVFGLDFSPNGRWLLWSASNSKAAPCLWDLKKTEGHCLHSNFNQEAPYSAAFSPDGKSFVIGWSIGGVMVYPTEGKPGDGKLLVKHQAPTYSIAYSPNGKLIATGGANGSVRFWDAKTGQ